MRVAFSATEALDASLIDERGRAYSEAPTTPRGALGERGPVCFRRGESVRLRFLAPEGAADARRPLPASLRVRFVAWASVEQPSARAPGP